jgi:chemotaxis receptor (MCP) glutamine deamidase CheD
MRSNSELDFAKKIVTGLRNERVTKKKLEFLGLKYVSKDMTNRRTR